MLKKEEYHSEVLTFRGTKPHKHQSSMTDALVSAMQARFPNTPFIKTTAIPSFRNWPYLQEDDVKGLKCY